MIKKIVVLTDESEKQPTEISAHDGTIKCTLGGPVGMSVTYNVYNKYGDLIGKIIDGVYVEQ